MKRLPALTVVMLAAAALAAQAATVDRIMADTGLTIVRTDR